MNFGKLLRRQSVR